MPVGGSTDYPVAVVGPKGQYLPTNLIGESVICESFCITPFTLMLDPIFLFIGGRGSPSVAIAGSFMLVFGGVTSQYTNFYNDRKNINLQIKFSQGYDLIDVSMKLNSVVI
jgi:hypothetical protein